MQAVSHAAIQLAGGQKLGQICSSFIEKQAANVIVALYLISFYLFSLSIFSLFYLLYRQIAENRAQRYKLQWTPAACRIKFKRNNARFFKALHE